MLNFFHHLLLRRIIPQLNLCVKKLFGLLMVPLGKMVAFLAEDIQEPYSNRLSLFLSPTPQATALGYCVAYAKNPAVTANQV
jgi:hypothetical protein